MKDYITFVNFSLNDLYKLRNENFNEKTQSINKFWVRLNEYNIIQLINNIEKNRKEELEYLQKTCESLLIYSLRLDEFGARFDNNIKGKVMRSDETTTKATEYLRHMLERIKSMNNKLIKL